MKRIIKVQLLICCVFALFLAIQCLNTSAQTQFIDVNNQPVFTYGVAGEWDDGAVWFPSVIKDGDTLRMWYSGGDRKIWDIPFQKIGYAWSLDGMNWNRYSGNPVIKPELSWEGRDVNFCTVIKDEDTLKMWYGAASKPGGPPTLIAYATSFDGINWSKHPEPVIILGPAQDWDDDIIAPHSVIKEEGEYKMWFWAGRPGFPLEASLPQIGLATSPDGIHWTKYNDPATTEAPYANSDPVVRVGSSGDWDSHRVINPIVLSTESGYEMWYSGLKAPINSSTKFEVGYATSEDGINWEKWPENPVIQDPLGWGKGIYAGSVLNYNETYHFWFACFHTPPTQARPQIGYLESLVPAWEELKSMDIARGGLQSCVIDNMIYVLGGTNSSGGFLDAVDVYNTNTNQWSNLEPMMKKLTEFNAEVVHNKIYSLGGWQVDYNTSKSTMEYDPDGNTWVSKKDCPITTGSNTSCVLNDTLYMLGGLEFQGSPDQKKTLFYVPETDLWDAGPDMIYDHGAYASSCIYDNKIFVFGGIHPYPTNHFDIHGKSEMYDPITQTWKELADMPVPVLNHVSIVHHDKFYIFGGDSGTYSHVRSYPTNTIQEYDPATDTWKLMQSMPFKRANMTGQKVGGFVYLFGGYQDDSRDYNHPLSEVWKFKLDSLKEIVLVTGISLDKDSLELKGSETATIIASLTPVDASDPSVSWSSGDSDVAIVDEGVVTGVAVGQTYIYVKTADGMHKDSCHITVLPGLGIATENANRWSIFPNPGKNLVNIETKYPDHYAIEITSLNGQQILTGKMEGSAHQIDLSPYPSGVYFITLRSKDFVCTRKIIKLL